MTTTLPGIRPAALEYATSADRALDGTAYASVTVGTIADALVDLCSAVGDSDDSLAAAIDAVGRTGTSSDVEILTEVLVEGMNQVCPGRSGATALIAAYLAAVTDAVASAVPDASVDREAVLGAGRVACDLLDRGQGPDSALLAVVAALFGVEAQSVEQLGSRLSGAEGVVAGASLGAAVGYLCTTHQAAVAAYLQTLGS